VFAAFSSFSPPGLWPGGEKEEKAAKGVREGAFLVAKHSLRWGRPSGGETKSTDRKPTGVEFGACRLL
jgi:hypothetical protein